MKNNLREFTTVTALLAVLLVWAAPLQADSVDQRIKELKDEVARLEAEQQRQKSEQIELRKDALAAEAALPKFEYAPGRGLTISAADESWQFSTSLRLNIHMYNYTNGNGLFNFGGQAIASGTDPLEFFPRRVRWYLNLCWDDCFWQFMTSIDGETAPRQASFRDQEIYMHFEKWNPYFPYLSFGLRRGGTTGRQYEMRSSTSDGKVEQPSLLDAFNWNTDGDHSGAGLAWDRVPVGNGDFQLFLSWASSRSLTWQDYVATDRSGMIGFIGTRPFSKLKDQKWIRGLDVGFGWQFQSYDNPLALPANDPGSVNIRLRNEERRGRQDWFRPATINNAFGASTGQNVGGGFAYVFIPGFQWQIGPYKARFNYMTTRFASNNDGIGGVWGYGFDSGNDVFVWSPKGFFTGSPSTAGSLMVSYNYEHGVMSCGQNCDAAPGSGAFHNQSYVLNQTSLWYWIRPALRVGLWWNYWGFANTPGQSGIAVGCWSGQKAFTASASSSNARVGKDCWWNSVNLGFQVQW